LKGCSLPRDKNEGAATEMLDRSAANGIGTCGAFGKNEADASWIAAQIAQ
jgi:hypothetical protein